MLRVFLLVCFWFKFLVNDVDNSCFLSVKLVDVLNSDGNILIINMVYFILFILIIFYYVFDVRYLKLFRMC